MANRKSVSNKVNVELSKNEASYVQGMLAAYRQQLEINKNGNSLFSSEIRKADKLERKFATA